MNMIYNIIGQRVVPMIIALIAIPITILTWKLGKYGIFTLGWVILGYLKISDFGFGPAMTKLIAELKDKPMIFQKQTQLLMDCIKITN